MTVPRANRKRATNDVRIGPISVLALIAILSMAILAVLAISTANASLVISQKQAESTADTYLAEIAAQDFVAEVEALAKGKGGSAAGSVQESLPTLEAHARDAAGGDVVVEAEMTGNAITADFACSGARTLKVSATLLGNGSLRIDEWRVTAIQNTEEPPGGLWIGA